MHSDSPFLLYLKYPVLSFRGSFVINDGIVQYELKQGLELKMGRKPKRPHACPSVENLFSYLLQIVVCCVGVA